MISLKRWKRRNRSSRSKSLKRWKRLNRSSRSKSLKRWKRLNRSFRAKSPLWKRWKPDAEFNMGARRVGIGIRAVEGWRPLICAVAGETAKTDGTTQLRRINFFQFITLSVLKIEPVGIRKLRPATVRKGNAIVTFPMRAKAWARLESIRGTGSEIYAKT